MLNDAVSWRSLANFSSYKKGALMGKSSKVVNSDNHYKTINSKHILWAKAGVYEQAYIEILKRKLTNITGDTLKLIIDATNISTHISMDVKILATGANVGKRNSPN
jgi:hypothetical protein